MKLTKYEENLLPDELFFKWLVEEKVSFLSLSNMYAKYLENENKKKNIENTRYSNLLAQYIEYGNLNNKNTWVRDKSIGTLYAYEKFKTAPIFDTWAEIIKNNSINTDLKTLDYEVYEKVEEEK